MAEDASLDEFGGDSDEGAEQADDPTPAKTTYAWGEGTACGACGSVVERRWQQDGQLVCTDCKTWHQS